MVVFGHSIAIAAMQPKNQSSTWRSYTQEYSVTFLHSVVNDQHFYITLCYA